MATHIADILVAAHPQTSRKSSHQKVQFCQRFIYVGNL